MIPICIRRLYLEANKPNVCACHNCQQARGKEAVLEYYRSFKPEESFRSDPFPKWR